MVERQKRSDTILARMQSSSVFVPLVDERCNADNEETGGQEHKAEIVTRFSLNAIVMCVHQPFKEMHRQTTNEDGKAS